METRNYGIQIAGVNVTSDNYNNITGDNIEGKVSYNPETKTLTLDNATIYGEIDFGDASNRITDITITLLGKSVMTGNINSVNGAKTINGTGQLKLYGNMDCWYEQNIIIEDCTININSKYSLWSWGNIQ